MSIDNKSNDMFLDKDQYLSVVIPAQSKALIFRIEKRANVGYNKIEYGDLPITAGDALTTYANASTTAPANGVLPANSYTHSGISFPYAGGYDATDMFYTPDTYHKRLFHVNMKVFPNIIRTGFELPKGLKQYRYQKGNVVVGVDKQFGFSRGGQEIVFLPELNYGMLFGNDLNINVRAKVTFDFAEYVVSIVTDPEVVYNILSGNIGDNKLRTVTLPIVVYDGSINDALMRTYGFDGFDIDAVFNMDRETAISQFQSNIDKYETKIKNK